MRKVLSWEVLVAQVPPSQLPQWHAGFRVGAMELGGVAHSAKMCLGWHQVQD